VALDSHGDLAAATSTGGVPGQLPGRISDSAVIAAGTYARNGSCAVSCTGTGEHFIRVAAAHDLVARLSYADDSLEAAAGAVIERLAAIGGTGGLIAVDAAGRVAMPFNAEVMNRASWRRGGAIRVCP
jgi:L-asparaginase / beta-aspartyl-peptidase